MAFASDKTRQGAAGVSTGYDIPYSARFNDDDSANLTWLQGTGNRRTWTWSGWVKRGNLTNEQPIITWQNNSENSDWDTLEFSTTDTIRYYMSGAISAFFVTNQVFRDTSAWYHICLAVDTTQATASNRVKLYVNGEQVTSFSTATYPSQNYDTWTNLSGRYAALGSNIYADTTFTKYLDGYLAEVNFVDGQALTPADFGETDEDYGHWKAKKYTGTYGTNGFYLDFKNSGSLGNDANGSNNWTPNNLAATDQMLDSPTNNFCTLNGVIRKYTGGGADSEKQSEGNLKLHALASNGVSASAWATMPITNGGKWYWEFVTQTATSNRWVGVGDNLDKAGIGTYVAAARTYGVFYKSSGVKSIDEAESAYGDSYTTGDVIGVALDMDNSNIYFSKNGVWQNSGVPTSGATGTGKANTSSLETKVIPALMADPNGTVVVLNFGQDSSFAGNKTAQGNADGNGYGDFYYTPPTGYLALCTQNLLDPAVIPSEHFNTVLYTGDGVNNATTSRSLTGVGFQPSLIIHKGRSDVGDHRVWDAVRGTATNLSTNTTAAEWSGAPETVTSFDSDGFTLGSVNGDWNLSGRTYVAWNWKANGTGVSNTNGSITSTVSANVDAGFSIVGYNGNQVGGATVGHGLSQAPEMVLIKQRTSAGHHWKSIMPPLGAGKALYLNLTNAAASGQFNNTLPTSTVFTLDTDTNCNESGADHIAYAFHSVEGYSKVGSYTGNGSTDGTFVHCGFRPAYVMVKKTTGTSANWTIWDNERPGYNESDADVLYANLSNSEWTGDGTADNDDINLVSNGFKLWGGADHAINGNGETYIFLAFAEHPFKYTNAR